MKNPDQSVPFAPHGLLCEMLAYPELTTLNTLKPKFGWIVPSGESQLARKILVASHRKYLRQDVGDLWDSGKVSSASSLNVPYPGQALQPDRQYFWKVKIWGKKSGESNWSLPQMFTTPGSCSEEASGYSLVKSEIVPVKIIKNPAGNFLLDFGRAAFATIHFSVTSPRDAWPITFHLGEKMTDTAVDRDPGGSIRYRTVKLRLKKGNHSYLIKIPPDKRNTGWRTIKMPKKVGEVMPFRFCEVENWPEGSTPKLIRQIAVHYPFSEQAAAFSSSNNTLNQIWELCRYSIKATSFCGLYVDGDRERYPREADAYLNQICHYAVDREFSLARRTHEFMLTHTSQWTEWILQSIFMAWADYVHTGNADSLHSYYKLLKAKTLLELAREDGLISTRTGLVTDALRKSIHYFEGENIVGTVLRDIVDWPAGERDNFEFSDINTVVNAFHYRALVLMSRIARVVDKPEDARMFTTRAKHVRQSINKKLFDPASGLYVDGEGVAHASLHANMFSLAIGLVPAERVPRIVEFIKSRGMACSVYGAQYLLEALYQEDETTAAFSLLTSREQRSWYNMLRVGSTISLEAWDAQFKPNLDWNHAWGAAPANIIPRYLMGVRPLEPGFGKVIIQPRPGPLEHAEATIPTIRGPIKVSFQNREDFTLEIQLPGNVTARVGLPLSGRKNPGVLFNGKTVAGAATRDFIWVEDVPSGVHRFEMKF